MSAAGSLAGRKRERPAQSPGPKGLAGQKGAAKALERLAAAHSACSHLLTSRAYPESLSELALALRHALGAKLVVVRESTGTSGMTAVAPPEIEARGWLERLDQRHLEGRESSMLAFDLGPRDAALPINGIRRFVVVPLLTSRGQGALWLGFGDHGPSSPEDLTSLSILGEHLSLCLQRAATKPSSNGAHPVDLPNGKHATAVPPQARWQATHELISLAAHELRTPLTPITMLLQSLERKARAGTTDVETILRARKQVNRLTHMIVDLLDLSRLRENRLTLTPVRVDLAKIALEAIQTFHEVEQKHRVELQGETANLMVVADESRLRQSVASLLDHVAHATPAGNVVQVILARGESSASITVRADRPAFGGDLQSADAPPPSHPRPEPIALGVLLAEGITIRQGGTLSLAPSRPHETRAEATFPSSTAD